jgi:hypothetical protein
VGSITHRHYPQEWQLSSLHENRIKECQLDLYADRTSTATMRANQPRLWFASMAYTSNSLMSCFLAIQKLTSSLIQVS